MKKCFARLVPKPVREAEKQDNERRQEIYLRPPSPFPQRLQKPKNDFKYRKFLDILSQYV